jgi:hypothetical protein
MMPLREYDEPEIDDWCEECQSAIDEHEDWCSESPYMDGGDASDNDA